MLHLASCWVCRRKWQCVGGLPAPTPPLVFVLLQLQSLGVLQLHCGPCLRQSTHGTGRCGETSLLLCQS